jgi:hypothetical protein
MERRHCVRSLSRDRQFRPAGRNEHSPMATGFEPKAGAYNPRCQMLIDGLREAAAALETLAESRPPDPIRMVSHTQAPKGLWFEHIPEFNVLFEAMTTLEMVATAGDVVELENPIRQRAEQLAKILRALAGDASLGAADGTRSS